VERARHIVVLLQRAIGAISATATPATPAPIAAFA
jgi:hypothetical protein